MNLQRYDEQRVFLPRTGNVFAIPSILCNLVYLVFFFTLISFLGMYYYGFDFPTVFLIGTFLQLAFFLLVLLFNGLIKINFGLS